MEDAVIADVTNFEHTPKASEPLILYYDEMKAKGKTYFYRIKAENISGSSPYSTILEVKSFKE
ncbi:MAG TPA: hypothetical protein DCQ31_12995 [Bacteroidales bacterium]|nr:hypothetical protein [Bacteroidales bacterium]